MDAGLVPVKRLAEAKQRLEERYGSDGRLRIARAMLADTMALCRSVDFLDWWVVTNDDEVREIAEAAGLRIVHERGSGLNQALRDAVIELSGVRADSVAIVPTDVPLAWAGDLQDLLDTGATSDVVVVPAAADAGTNALYLSPPDLMPPHFGTGSFRSHISEAESLGVRCAILDLPRLALDIDTPDDADAFLTRGHPGTSETLEVLRELSASRPLNPSE